MNMTISGLKKFADGGDANAKRLLVEIERFAASKFQQTNTEIQTVIADITAMLVKLNAVTGRDMTIPLAVAELANEWIEILRPADDETEIIS